MINQEDLTKYEKQILSYISMIKLENEMLFDSLISASETIKGYGELTLDFARKGALSALQDVIEKMYPLLDYVQLQIKEANRRALEHGS
jgi:hypothetical protein